ncbi:AAA family ATPase [Marinicella rhabdoformis]|uniref:AAA family ATPase n=1 Tax=Marinicella rhabdoformis TaxID=2580566 RepID=UPI0012AEC6C7|nr:AAA family ATPase [Marinicella rhabdoformis]
MDFQVIKYGQYPPEKSFNTGYLVADNWDDYGYKTLFQLIIFDDRENKHEIGSVKISYRGHSSEWTEEKLQSKFTNLPEEFYSLGQDVDYYTNFVKIFKLEKAREILTALNDIAIEPQRRKQIEDEDAFKTSLLRGVNYSSIEHQFQRILNGEAALSKYDFTYKKDKCEKYSDIELKFKVSPNSKPSTNMHVLIGRNGVGKTTVLNNMVNALLKTPDHPESNQEYGVFTNRLNDLDWVDEEPISDDYFAGLVSISFSAFDSFDPPAYNLDQNQGRRFSYIGLKKNISNTDEPEWVLKDKAQLGIEFADSLTNFFAYSAKNRRWLNAIATLESDSNFKDMDIHRLVKLFDRDSSKNKQKFNRSAQKFFKLLSSGHAIVLLSITKLVETVEEKTIVFVDEPESHLHPPLLSAFIRALNDILVNRNGLAIIATHSPVVLQEIPKSCVNILIRNGIVMNVYEPEIETFAENVGILTREVFRLEVSKSGFHDLLSQSVDEGKNYEEIIDAYDGQIGFEGKALLRSLILSKKHKQTEG